MMFKKLFYAEPVWPPTLRSEARALGRYFTGRLIGMAIVYVVKRVRA